MSAFRCLECGAKDSYEYKEVEREYVGEGYDFTMRVRIPFCKECGAAIVNESLESEIAKKANLKIRESKGIIQQEEILEIISQYDASQKFLSRMLGWGEITLTRYINRNFTPNYENSEKIKSIKNPYVFKHILDDRLEESHNELLKDKAFVKLKNSVMQQIDELEKRKGKVFKVVNWFMSQASEDNRMTGLTLQNLLYFSQGWNYAINNEELFNDECEIRENSVAYGAVYDEFEKFKYKPLPYVEKQVELPEREIKVLQCVKDNYFEVYTPKTLDYIYHLEEESMDVLIEIGDVKRLEKGYLREYYSKIAKKYNVSEENMSNIKVYLCDLLKKQCKV